MICLKKTKFGLLFAVLLSCCCVLLATHSVNALVIQDGSSLVLTGGNISTSQGGITGSISGSDLIFTINNGTDVTVNGLYFTFDTQSGTSPNYLMSLNVRYEGNNTTNSGYMILDGLLSDQMDTITSSCVEVANNNLFNPSGGILVAGNKVVTCSYIFLSHGNYNSFISRLNSRIVRFVNTNPTEYPSKIVISPGFIRHISFDGLSASDRQWLESVIPEGTTIQQVEEGVKNALDDEMDEQQQEYEDQADDNEQQLNSDSSAAQGTSTSLLSAFAQFVGVLTSASPTNCILDGTLVPHISLGSLNLCQNSPPPAIVALGSLVLIAFVVPLAYNTVRMMLNLIAEFQR